MRRLLAFALLGTAVPLMAALSPSPSVAVTKVASTAAEEVTGSVARVRVFRLEHPAEDVAAYWRGNTHAHVSLAFSTDGTHFGRRVSADRDEVGLDRHNGMTYGAIRSASGAIAVRVTSDRPIGSLTVLGMAEGTTRTHRTVTWQGAQAATTQPVVESRAAWGADPQYMTWAPAFYATKKLIVHHTDTSNDYADRAGAEAQIRSIYYYHSVTQTWGDIGYNFLIDKFGNVYEGRYSRDYAGANPSGDDVNGNGVTGAHTSGWNSGTVGIAMLGTFTAGDVTPAARQALESLLAWEASRNGIDPQATSTFVNPVSGATTTTANIASHRDYAATLCPGDAFYATLPTIRSDVAALIGTAPAPDTTAPTAPSGLTATPAKYKVTLVWKPATDNVGVTGYQIWRSTSATTGFSQIGTTAGTTYVNGSLHRRTTYYYKVRATDAANNLSAFTPVVSVRTN